MRFFRATFLVALPDESDADSSCDAAREVEHAAREGQLEAFTPLTAAEYRAASATALTTPEGGL